MTFLYYLETLRTDRLNEIFAAVTHLGGVTAFILIVFIVLWCVDRREGFYLLFAGIVGTLLGQVLKLMIHMPRPWVLDPSFPIVEAARSGASGYSCPSGHTIDAVTCFGGMARWTRRRLVCCICVLLALLIPFTRMYLGVHTPLDVGLGAIIGCAALFGFYPFFAKGRTNTPALRAALWAMLALTAALLLFVQNHDWSMVNEENLTDGIKNVWLLLGVSAGLVLSGLLWRLDWNTAAPFFRQIVKIVLGLAFTIACEELVRWVASLCGVPLGPAHALRGGALAFAAVGIWPRSFYRLSGMRR